MSRGSPQPQCIHTLITELSKIWSLGFWENILLNWKRNSIYSKGKVLDIKKRPAETVLSNSKFVNQSRQIFPDLLKNGSPFYKGDPIPHDNHNPGNIKLKINSTLDLQIPDFFRFSYLFIKNLTHFKIFISKCCCYCCLYVAICTERA